MAKKTKFKEKLYQPAKLKKPKKAISIIDLAYRLTNIDLLCQPNYLN
jgi:hypothetical protein